MSSAGSADAVEGTFTHVVADFVGVSAAQLRDATMLQGLLIAAAGAAGFSAVGAPIVRKRPDEGVAAVLLLDGCHVTLHTFPASEMLLLDVLASSAQDGRKALDVFARRLLPREIRSESRVRG